MRTCTYLDVLNLAGELAGRTRDKLPTAEATMLQGFLGIELLKVWNAAQWPFLIPAPQAVAVDGTRGFSKNEGTANEIGDVLGIYTADPTQTTKFRRVDWDEQDDRIVIAESLAQVYVEYVLPATDLVTIGAGALDATTLPLGFKAYLGMKAAGYLMNADVAGSGNGWLALAETHLAGELNRIKVPWWRGGVQVRSSGTVNVNAGNS